MSLFLRRSPTVFLPVPQLLLGRDPECLAVGIAEIKRRTPSGERGHILDQITGILEQFAGVIPYRRKLAALAAENGMGPAELYMRYLLSFPEIDGVLTGVDNPEQLEYNLHMASGGPLDEALQQKIRDLIPELPELWIHPNLWPKKQ